MLTRARYGTFQLAQGTAAEWSAKLFAERSVFLVREIFRQFSTAGGLLLSAGCALALVRTDLRKFSATMLIFVVCAGPLFLMMANVTVEGSAYGIVLRFLPLPLMSLSLLGIMGLSAKRSAVWVSIVLMIVLFRIPQAHSMRTQFLAYDFGRNVLRTLPPRTLLLSDRADECEFVLAYLFYSEQRRNDVRFADCNAGVTRSIYGNDYYNIWGAPRHSHGGGTETVLRVERSVYYATVEPQMIAIPRYRSGIIFRAKPAGIETFVERNLCAPVSGICAGVRGNNWCVARNSSALIFGTGGGTIEYISQCGFDGSFRFVVPYRGCKYLAKNAYGPADEFFSMR